MDDIVGKVETHRWDWEEKPPSTTLTLTNQYGTFSISRDELDQDICQMYVDFFKPLLLAAGFQLKTIEEHFEKEI